MILLRPVLRLAASHLTVLVLVDPPDLKLANELHPNHTLLTSSFPLLPRSSSGSVDFSRGSYNLSLNTPPDSSIVNLSRETAIRLFARYTTVIMFGIIADLFS